MESVIPKTSEAVLGEGDRPHMDTSLNKSMYDTDIIDFFDVYSVGETGDAIPFEKGISLVGVNGGLVELKATFDDCAMVNVIDKVVFEGVKSQLSEPRPSRKVMRMANGTLIPSNGSWSGIVVVDGVRANGTFEIFASGGAWNVLFGKPLLQAFDAIHEYTTDTITLHSNNSEQAVVIQNENPDGLLLGELLRKPEVAVAQVSDMGEHSLVPPLRSRQVHGDIACVPIDHPLDTAGVSKFANPRMNLGKPPCQTAYFYYTIQEEQAMRSRTANYKRKIRVRRRKERKLKSRALHEEWDRLEMSGKLGRSGFDKKLRNTKAARERRERSVLRVWNRTPWDFGEPIEPKRQGDDSTSEIDSEMARVIGDRSGDRRARVEDSPDEGLHAEGLRKSKVAVASVSNPGARANAAPLKHRHVTKIPARYEHTEKLTDADILLLQKAEDSLDDSAPGTEQPEIPVDADTSVFTRATAAFKPERVAEILRHIEIGSDLSPAERIAVEQTIRDFADVYALSISEVKHIPGASHKLHIPEGATFNTKIRQQQLSPPKAAYFSKALDVMLEAGICEPIDAKDVKCVSPITLAAKAHSTGGLTMDELCQRLNQECEQIGIDQPFIGPQPTSPASRDSAEPNSAPQKFRVCTNYKKLNEVTQVLPMPQGDIRTKQQAVSGHRWISLFDFAAGFYAVEIAEESRPYTAFYVENRGYFVYRRMPFGLTGAPSYFNEVTAKALHGLVGTMLQLFVDDGAMAGDIFADKLADLRTFFTRCREEHLSLSPQKSKLFMSEVVFAGERVGTNGIRGDLTKLTAVVNWQRPTTIQNLEAFLGLTGYFRPLIKNYCLLEKPLKDLANTLVVPAGGGKQAYRNAARTHYLQEQWTPAHDKAFVTLKIALTSAPVVKGPKYDGSSFIVTTDGCKDGFAGILSQRFSWEDKRGATHERIHPIAFASKRTSDSESRYQPYLLEFAALKFSLDKFSNVVGGYPIEIETDCKALRDTIINNKLNATHARWLDGIMGHHIIDCRHRPGRENQAVDGISRQFTDSPHIQGDGHDWTVDPSWEANMGLTYDIWTTQLDSEQTSLRERFANEPVFLDVIDAMNNVDHGKRVRDKRRARHRMLGYQIEKGRLYRIGDGKSTRARPRLECVTQQEAVELARIEHEKGGHFGRDLIKISLLDRICSPRLDKSIMTAIVECGRCKGFGGSHLAALLEPITRRHPWELMVGDYMSMPVGKGGFHTIGLFMDVYSQKIFGFKFTTYGSTATTIASLNRIRRMYRMPEVFMADGGSHFAGAAVGEWCIEHNSRYQQVAAYSPWVNGLLEGTNGKLLSRLKRLCAPNLGEDEWAKITRFEDLPAVWPDHFDAAIEHLNQRILPAYKFSPNELCLGTVVNTSETPIKVSSEELAEASVAIQNEYVGQQNLDAYSHILDHANKRKAAFDKKVLASRDGVIEYKKGDLVQSVTPNWTSRSQQRRSYFLDGALRTV